MFKHQEFPNSAKAILEQVEKLEKEAIEQNTILQLEAERHKVNIKNTAIEQNNIIKTEAEKEAAKIQNLLNNYETKVITDLATEIKTMADDYKKTAHRWLFCTITLIVGAIVFYVYLMLGGNITSKIQNFYFIVPVSLLIGYLIFMFINKHYKNNALYVEYKDLHTKIISAKQVGAHLAINANDMSDLGKQYLTPIAVGKNNKTPTLKQLNEVLKTVNNLKDITKNNKN